MHYIVGSKANRKIIKKICSNGNNNGSYEIYSESVSDTIHDYYDLFSSAASNCTIRIEASKITEHDIILIKEKNIKLSVIVCPDNIITELIATLREKQLNFELIFTDEFVEKNGMNLISQCLASSIQIRVLNKKLTTNMYFRMICEIQEEAIEMEGSALLSILDPDKVNIVQECMFVGTDRLISTLYGSQYYDNDVVIFSQEQKEFFALSTVAAISTNVINYLRESAIKRIQSRILQTSHKSKNENEILEKSLDAVFVYANRVRSIVAVPFAPIAPYYLSTLVSENGFSSLAIECNENNFAEEFDKIKDKVKVIGFYCACNNEILVINMIKHIKSISPNIVVIVGGPQAIALNEDFFIESGADIVSVGEGEQTTVELLEYYIHGNGVLADIKGIKYYSCDKLHKNEEREVIKDLDAYPFAKLRRKDISKYNDTSRIFVLTGRGCPNRCTFCYEGANSRKVRYRSMEKVFEEINYLLTEFPLANVLHVLDDTFTCNQERVYDFCNRIRELRKKRDINWVCEVHINTVYNKPELLQYMIDSGLKGFQIGLESGSNQVLKAYKKNTSSQMIKSFFDMCTSLKGNFFIEGNIIFGGPFESKNTIQESLDLCRYILDKGRGILELSTLCFSPLPNTDITLNPQKYGLEISMDDVNNSILAMAQIVTSSHFLTKNEIREEKEKFDKEIDAIYNYQTLRMTDEQMLRFWNKKAKVFNVGSKWGAKLNSLEHFANYALAYTFDNPQIVNFDVKVYPIRTFESMDYLNRIFEKNGFSFSKKQYDELMLSNGRYNMQQISIKLGVDFDQLRSDFEVFKKMCLIYYSRF